MCSASEHDFVFNIRTYEICPIRWFLVRSMQLPGLRPGTCRYYILHMSDLIDGNFHDIYANRTVNFKLNNSIFNGTVLEASNRMLCLVDRIQQVTENAVDIYESTDKLLQRLNCSLKEINTMAASLKRVSHVTNSVQQQTYFKQLMEQLINDGDELVETKAFFNSLNLICFKSQALIEHHKYLPLIEVQKHLMDYLHEIAIVVGDVQRYQRVFHSPHCICNVHHLPGKLAEIVNKCIEAENEVIDR